MSSSHKKPQSTCCSSCETLKRENTVLKAELNTLQIQYHQLIEETKDENFSERRVNLLKAHILQLEHQVFLLSDAMDSQIQLLSDLQVYGENLEHKLKSNDDICKDIQHLTKLNKRLKQVPISKDKLSLPVPYTGRYINELSLIDVIENKQYLNFKQIGWLESQLSLLHCQLTELHTVLNVLPSQADIPTVCSIDPIYLLLKKMNEQISSCIKSIKCLSQELLTISLLIPGQSMDKFKGLHENIDINVLLKELHRNKQKGREILETVIGTYETAQMKQDKQLHVQEKELSRIQQLLTNHCQYIESLFTELQNGYKTSLSDIYSQINTPLQEFSTQYKTLASSNSELRTVNKHLQELNQVMIEFKELIDSEKPKRIDKFCK